MTPRLTRSESQAVTRQKLIDAACELFRKEGYAATSIDRIADAAGFSKGAVYSNFENKEAIFLEVLEAQGQESLDDLLRKIDEANGKTATIEALVTWADERSRSGVWSLTILEHARAVRSDAPSLLRQKEILQRHWVQLGSCLLRKFPGLEAPAETLGALLHEIAYAPAMTFMGNPGSGALMQLTIAHILRE